MRGGLAKYVVLALLFVLAGVSTGLFLTVRKLSEVGPAGEQLYEERVAAPGDADTGGALDLSRRTAIVSAAERVGPATVSISATGRRLVRAAPTAQEEFFRRFFGGFLPGRVYEEERHTFGSGVVIDEDGYILTNEHVVRGFEEVQVVLTDGRAFEGEVLGGDQRYDLAVVKIEGDDLPVAPLGDSDDIMVGEWAIAIGNPFGNLLSDRQPTVTAGVVSATNRDVISDDASPAIYKDMIQTDAAINPGNSGGPLVNSNGEVVGINSFIFSMSGGSEGVGFAIPINTARNVIDEMIQYGRVRDIWVGIAIQELTPGLAERLSLGDVEGVIASFVEPGSPAHRAGIREGDIILAVNGDDVTSIREARRAIFGSRVGDIITLRVRRGTARLDFEVTVEEAAK
ncbi:MAG: trypsin-like serine protease [Candidatus Eisenbacteria bacterium]|nr:trypsin-like serine protease [Candidatus Eisenbacteria bacterium]